MLKHRPIAAWKNYIVDKPQRRTGLSEHFQFIQDHVRVGTKWVQNCYNILRLTGIGNDIKLHFSIIATQL